MNARRFDLLFVALPAVFALAIIAIAAILTSEDIIPKITRDISAVSGVHPLTGALSSLGNFIWFGVASILLFSALLAFVSNKKSGSYLASGGALSLILWVDDFFLIHEYIAPLHFGVNEQTVLAGQASTAGAYLFWFRHQILRTEYSILVLSLIFLSLSVLCDQLISESHVGSWSYLVEDGFKWLGIVAWARYHVSAAFSLTTPPATAHDRSKCDLKDAPVANADSGPRTAAGSPR